MAAPDNTQRDAILRRLRELLVRQSERFNSYLAALEKQQAVIKSGSPEELIAHVELEERIIADIFSIQKVIDPLEAAYRSSGPFPPSDDIPALKITLEKLQTQAAAQTACNRNLLSVRMAEIRAEIDGLKNNPFTGPSRSAYRNSVTASLIDLQG